MPCQPSQRAAFLLFVIVMRACYLQRKTVQSAHSLVNATKKQELSVERPRRRCCVPLSQPIIKHFTPRVAAVRHFFNVPGTQRAAVQHLLLVPVCSPSHYRATKAVLFRLLISAALSDVLHSHHSLAVGRGTGNEVRQENLA